MTLKFNAGDLVQLKSGGPKMTVEKWLPHNDAYKCTWFSGAKHNAESFAEDSLQLFVEETK